MDTWDNVAKLVADLNTELARLDRAIDELEAALLCAQLALSVVVEASTRRLHESAN